MRTSLLTVIFPPCTKNEGIKAVISLMVCTVFPLKQEHIKSLGFKYHSKTILFSHKISRTNLSYELHHAAVLWHHGATGFPGLEKQELFYNPLWNNATIVSP